ncbi:MAG: hypothetical protein E4G98_04635 [Promethearchaeota archaeon]|nr:MAG: hypothetical protein E4G98_04635 [Candidatus Lokiarchaeota archaeon]
MSSNTLRFLYHEQWLGISTLTSLTDENLPPQIQKMEEFVNAKCQAITADSLNHQFVPDPEDRNRIAISAKNLGLSLSWVNDIEDFRYQKDEHTYSKLGYILIRIRIKDVPDPNFRLNLIRPQYLQQIIFGFWFSLIKEFRGDFLLDEKTVPYAFSVCSEVDPHTDIVWTQAMIKTHKREIGDWCELYSGQFPDYHDQLYDRRIASNLSNRTSEMHFVQRNSALLFMQPENYANYFVKDKFTPNSTGYMFNTVIKTVMQIRNIGFALVLVNSEIDIDTAQLTSPEFKEKDPTLIKDDLEKTTRLKMILQRTLAPFFTDLSRSHRQHYHTLLQHCVTLYDIEKNWQMLSDKLESNTQGLNSIFLEKQEEASERQEKNMF